MFVTPADVQDRDAAKVVLGQAKGRLPRLLVVWADGAYAATVAWVAGTCRFVLATVLRPLGVRGFVVLPKRWIVERTFAWLGRYRRHSRDYERLTESSEAMIRISMIHRMVRRIEPGRKATRFRYRKQRRRKAG